MEASATGPKPTAEKDRISYYNILVLREEEIVERPEEEVEGGEGCVHKEAEEEEETGLDVRQIER